MLHTLISTLRRQRQVDLCEFKDSPVHIVNSRTARATRETLSQNKTSQAVVACTFNPSTWEAEVVNLCEFKASLVYSMSSRTVIEKPYLKSPKTKQNHNKTNHCLLKIHQGFTINILL